MKILFLDLETSPMTAHTWGLWQQNVSIQQILDSTEVMCFGARWHGTRKVIFKSVHHDGKEGMLRVLHDLMNEADVLVGWNSAQFDHKHIKREFLEAGMLPPSPTKDVDLMRVAKQNFRFPSYKLDYVSQRLGVGAKVKHSGFELWIKCMAGDDKAWREMKRYQLQDVNLLVDLWEKFLPWIKGLNVPAFVDDDDAACTNCGGHDMKRRGYEVLTSGKYQKFQCNGCGKWLRGKSAVTSTTLRGI